VNAPSFDRVFSMGAFEALRLVRLQRRDYPKKAFEEIIEIVRVVQADGAAHDFEAAISLESIVEQSAPALDALTFYRECIVASIMAHRPVWVRTISLGRKKFSQKLGGDEQQCFASAGLLDDPPTEKAIFWWDRVSAQTRLMGDEIKMVRARDAEKRSLEFECERLKKLGIDRTPTWMSIDDNTAGYDILSFDHGPGGPVARVLEVKSTIASPLRFYVTRNEWDTCQKMGNAYHFHIWDMKTGNLFERTAADIAPHIPNDSGKGRWANAEIPVGA
jgi:Domain of unknown function (DUF3883)